MKKKTHKQKLASELQASVERITAGYIVETKKHPLDAQRHVKEALLGVVKLIDSNVAEQKTWKWFVK